MDNKVTDGGIKILKTSIFFTLCSQPILFAFYILIANKYYWTSIILMFCYVWIVLGYYGAMVMRKKYIAYLEANQ